MKGCGTVSVDKHAYQLYPSFKMVCIKKEQAQIFAHILGVSPCIGKPAPVFIVMHVILAPHSLGSLFILQCDYVNIYILGQHALHA